MTALTGVSPQTDRQRMLHFSWIASFICLLLWFNHVALLPHIRQALSLSEAEVHSLLLLNLALAIPARLLAGWLVDCFGPRLVYAALLFLASIPCFLFGLADSFDEVLLARCLLGGVGAGFAIGLRMLGEWFPPEELGSALASYAGRASCGAAIAMLLPVVAVLCGCEIGWRFAVCLTGLVSLLYSFIWYLNVGDAPRGTTYQSAGQMALEVQRPQDLLRLLLLKLPLYLSLLVLLWLLSPAGLAVLEPWLLYWGNAALLLVFVLDCLFSMRVARRWREDVADHQPDYSLGQTAVVAVLYFSLFGSELALLSMLPLYLDADFGLDHELAALMASGCVAVFLLARPLGWWLGARMGRRRALRWLTAGLALVHALLAWLESTVGLPLVLPLLLGCGLLLQAGEGCMLSSLPMIRRRLTGQIAGLAGAYGCSGALCGLLVLILFGQAAFFALLAVSALLGCLVSGWLVTPQMPAGQVNGQRWVGAER